MFNNHSGRFCDIKLLKSTPSLTMMIGLPGYINEINIDKSVILSPESSSRDELRRNLECGNDVVYDATRLNKRLRTEFLESVRDIMCKKIALCIMIPFEVYLDLNQMRGKTVSEETIKEIYMSWNPPNYSEGFTEIKFLFPEFDERRYNLYDLFYGSNGIAYFDQESRHHSLSLGNHCLKTFLLIKDKFPYDENLQYAALLHDIGKVKTKTNEARYPNHSSVGAYDSCFYLKAKNICDSNIAYISNLIYFHMRPYFAWKDKNKEDGDCKLIGIKMQKDVYRLHYADVSAR